jgi:hypothetical protein
LTPSKAKGAAGSSGGGGRRLFAGGSDSSGSEYSESDSDGADDTYRPDPHHLSGRGKGALSKRKRHGQLPGSTNATKVCGCGWACHCLSLCVSCAVGVEVIFSTTTAA